MKEYIIPSDNFIAGWYIDHKVCDGLISYFDESPDQGPGEIGSGIREEYKVSTDVAVIPRVNDERIDDYILWWMNNFDWIEYIPLIIMEFNRFGNFQRDIHKESFDERSSIEILKEAVKNGKQL